MPPARGLPQSTAPSPAPSIARFQRRCARLAGILGMAAASVLHVEAAIPLPKILDERLELSLFASEPDIVTPIGLAIDERNRLFVIESHTHLPPQNYAGPDGDRIKIFEDTGRDGKPDKQSIFAEGIQKAMNLAFSPAGELYVVCAKEVLWLRDQNRDAASESRSTVLQLLTKENYAHNSLLGITFSPDGWMYLARGNIGGHAYTLQGSDGTSVSGYGDGGHIIRCRPDGTRVELIATGFWNPFDIKFDSAGRLLCVDNDPDSRGPNRLLHIVTGGDYGYKSLYGGSGLHPFQAWEGELPGTLPMMAGVGEAPSALLEGRRAALPPDYHASVLVTIWGEHTVMRYRTWPQGASLLATNQVLIEGSQFFRPVALEADREGIIYLTDWVERDYPNHGKGRIWRLAAKRGIEAMKPRAPFEQPSIDFAARRLQELARAESAEDYEMLKAGLIDPDPFVRNAARRALQRLVFRAFLLRDLEHANPEVRLGALLVLRAAQHPNPAPILRKLFSDQSEEVRLMALLWAGEAALGELEDGFGQTLAFPDVSPRLFETYLAARQNLMPEVTEAYRKKTRGNEIKRQLRPEWLESIAQDARLPEPVRALAIAKMEASLTDHGFQILTSLLKSNSSRLRSEAIRTLSKAGRSHARLIEPIAFDLQEDSEIRADAVLALSPQPSEVLQRLSALLKDPAPAVHIEAARTLRRAADHEPIREALSKAYETWTNSNSNPALIEQIEFALFGASAGASEPLRSRRPQTPEAWQTVLASGGHASSGRRVFYSEASACSQCHRVHGRGGQIGPDLTYLGRSAQRRQLIQSILSPSDEIAPQFQGWTIETRDGETHYGLQLHHKSGGAIDLITLDGATVRFPGNQIAAYAASKKSLMPDGLHDTMTVEDFRDLLAYLESLR